MRRSIYAGAIQANVIGSFVRMGEPFFIIHPGFDAQGRKRVNWTQVVHEDVPIWEHKLAAPLPLILERFEANWTKHIGAEAVLLAAALAMCKRARRACFKDGESGVEPGPTLADGRPEGRQAPA